MISNTVTGLQKQIYGTLKLAKTKCEYTKSKQSLWSVVNGIDNDRYKSSEVQMNRLQCNSKNSMLITQSSI